MITPENYEKTFKSKLPSTLDKTGKSEVREYLKKLKDENELEVATQTYGNTLHL